ALDHFWAKCPLRNQGITARRALPTSRRRAPSLLLDKLSRSEPGRRPGCRQTGLLERRGVRAGSITVRRQGVWWGEVAYAMAAERLPRLPGPAAGVRRIVQVGNSLPAALRRGTIDRRSRTRATRRRPSGNDPLEVPC